MVNQNEKRENVKNWIEVLKDFGKPGLKTIPGFYSFEYNSGGTFSDSMPFIHAIAHNSDSVTGNVLQIVGINLNYMTYDNRVQYIKFLSSVENGYFGEKRQFGKIYTNELRFIHPDLPKFLRTYNFSNMSKTLFIENNNIEYVTKKSIGSTNLTHTI